jgi:hypothetical protein
MVAAACAEFGAAEDGDTTGNVGDASADGAETSTDVDGSFDARGLRHFVFVTSGTFPGYEVADEKCMAAARASGALAGRRFKGWFSTTTGAKARLVDYGPWYTTADAALLVTDWDHLLSTHEQPIDSDEKGAGIGATPVWTGTSSEGLPLYTCDSWTDAAALGVLGSTSEKTGAWTLSGYAPCAENHHLYCFEQPP